MNVLFICKHNRFRSKVAEAFFDKYNFDKDSEARSAGIRYDPESRHVADSVKSILKNMGARLKDDVSHLVKKKDVVWADKIIVVANDVDYKKFPKSKVMVWPVPDCSQSDKKEIKRISLIIREHVISFLKERLK